MRYILVLFLILCLPFPAFTQDLRGRVVAIADGDTLTILTESKEQIKIRLAGIDAPEKSQPFGNKSKENLSRLVFGRTVMIEGHKTDRYGRTVAKVLIGGIDAGLEQVKAGLAWHFKQYQREQRQADQKNYTEAEDRARADRVGLWQDPTPIAPWDFRHSSRSQNPEPQQSQSENRAEIRGNRNSGIYHTSECKDYDRIALKNRMIFNTEEEAKAAGFRKAKNCN